VKDFLYKAITLLCLIFTGQYSAGQGIATNLVFDQISKEQGLPDNAINFIYQDSRGFLWLATSHGLSRYDGRSFKNYTTLGKNGITDLVVNSITEDKEGNIWFGTESGLNKLDPFTEAITQYHEGSGPGTIPYKWCNYLYTDLDKNLWLSTEKGLALYNSNNNSFQNYPISLFWKDDRINKFIKKTQDDKAGKLWLSTSYGVKAFDKKTKTHTSYINEEINGQLQKQNVFYSLFIDHHGKIWAGTFSGTLFLFNKSANVFEEIKLEGINENKFTINDISEIKVQDTWYLLLATTGGLISLKQPGTIGFAATYSLTLAGYALTKIYTDRQLNLWVTSGEGLFKLNPNSFAFKWFPLTQKNKEPLFIFHIIPDIKNPETVFYLTTQSGWYKYDAVMQTIAQHILPEDRNQLLKNINNSIQDGTGYWFTSVRGFGYYDIYNNKLLDLSQHPFSASGQNTTGFIVKATETDYWVTLRRSGILVFNRVTQKDTVIFGDKNKPDNTYGNSIYDIQKGIDGNIWFTSRNKLYRVNPKDLSYKFFLTPKTDEKVAETKISPFRILFTKSGRLIVSSNLRIYEFRNEQLVTIYPAKGFSSYSIEKITEDAAYNLWVQSTEGVFKTDSSFLRWEAKNNLPGWDYGTNITEINTDRPGEIIFSSDAKLGLLKVNLLQKSASPFQVIISRIRYGEKENYLVSERKETIKSSYKDAVEIELSPVDFIGEKENKILYRLSGWDDEWKELGSGSMVRYEQLPPGDYTFVTKSVNATGMESAETKMRFTVIPLFYRSWWFISLLVIVLTTGIFLFYRYKLKKVLELEQIRSRIATDLHDDIGATLSSISMYSQAVKSQLKEKNPQLENVLDKMGENSRDMVTSMSDIVWAINPDNDDGEKLVKRMESYATDMCAVKNIRLFFNTDEKLNTVSLPLELRKNVYLIFKEAVNNAVKYSGAKNIWVLLRLQNKKLALTVKDDGEGFEEGTIKKGNGLKNIRSRAKEIKGVVIIDSAEGKGTTVSLNCII
jgi:ligand-binding sensor domain-containing protein/two-component sensor histidine kinase